MELNGVVIVFVLSAVIFILIKCSNHTGLDFTADNTTMSDNYTHDDPDFDYRDWIGRKYVGENIVDDDASRVVRKSDLPTGARVLSPDSMYTTDYRPDRLNLQVDSDSVIQSIRWG